MEATISAITLGVKDVEASKRFYAEGLGWTIEQDFGQWVSFSLEDGRGFGLLEREALAADAGTEAPAGGFSGVTFSYLVGSAERVDAVLAEADAAGGSSRARVSSSGAMLVRVSGGMGERGDWVVAYARKSANPRFP
jgi:hypothetical protein